METPRTVVGASDHYGRAEMVTLALCDGAPVLLDRRRVALIDARLPVAPYHHEAMELELRAAVELVERVRRSAWEHARAAIASLREQHPVDALVLAASPFARLPDSLEDVLRSRPLTLAADGMLYREALAAAAARSGMRVHRLPRKTDPTVLAAKASGIDASQVAALVADLGRSAGPPWRQDHKWAAAAALVALGPRMNR